MLALALAVARIRDSCSGVDERSTRDFALYLGFGRAGLCRGRNPG